MNPLQRTLIEKLGHDNGFEHVLTTEPAATTLASARHRTQVKVSLPSTGGFYVLLHPASPALLPELRRTFASASEDATSFNVDTDASLALLLRRAASLSQALPRQTVCRVWESGRI